MRGKGCKFIIWRAGEGSVFLFPLNPLDQNNPAVMHIKRLSARVEYGFFPVVHLEEGIRTRSTARNNALLTDYEKLFP